MGKVDLVRFASAEALAKAAASDWMDQVAARSEQCCAFSGGRIAEEFFTAITTQALERRLSLAAINYFWADERCVPPDHPDSNYRVTNERLLKPLQIPAARVHRIKGELDPELAAKEASEEFGRVVRPPLDFVFLGMGEDGHVASIFPDDNMPEPIEVNYRPVIAPKPPPRRITLVRRAILAARNVWVLVSGPGKEEALGKSLRADPSVPLGKVIAGRDFTRIFTNISGK